MRQGIEALDPGRLLGACFRLPSGSMVQVRCLDRDEAVVRRVDADGALSAGAFNLRIDFLLRHGQRVMTADGRFYRL